MSGAATPTNLQDDSIAPVTAAYLFGWRDDQHERARWIEAAERETERLYRLAVAFLAMWRAENPRSAHADPQTADALSELARQCHIIGVLEPQVDEAFNTIARALRVGGEGQPERDFDAAWEPA